MRITGRTEVIESPSASLGTERYRAAWEKTGRQNPDSQESNNVITADSDTQMNASDQLDLVCEISCWGFIGLKVSIP